VIVLLLGSGAVAASCTTSPGSAARAATARSPNVTVTTSLPTSATSGPTTPPSLPTNCQAGSVAVTVSLTSPTHSVCVHSGSTLTVTFDKSVGGLGVPGPWTIPPLHVEDQSVLSIISSSPSGQHLTTALKAGAPGITAVSAYFDEECSSGETTPCTIPPQSTIDLDVTVVGS
jgi:hypothetical protein